jgi:transcriptional regulator with XRE-family HTH domain
VRIQDLAQEIRRARVSRGLTQARLAEEVGLSRETLSLLENGRVPDLGVRKVLAVLEKLGLDMTVEADHEPRRRDYVRMACITASVSFKAALTEDELIHALVTGKVPAKRSPHLRTLLDEAPATLLNGLVAEAARWTKPGKLEKNLHRLAHDSGATRRIDEWLKIG